MSIFIKVSLIMFQNYFEEIEILKGFFSLRLLQNS